MRAKVLITGLVLISAGWLAWDGLFGSRPPGDGAPPPSQDAASPPHEAASTHERQQPKGEQNDPAADAQSAPQGQSPSGKASREPQHPLRYERETRKVVETAASPPKVEQAGVRHRRVVPDSAGSLKTEKNKIVLAGITALEPDAQCTTSNGKKWPCGRMGMFALRRFIRGRAILCDHMGELDDAVLARCSVGRFAIDEWLVRQGWATPSGESEELKSALELAKEEGKGQWKD